MQKGTTDVIPRLATPLGNTAGGVQHCGIQCTPCLVRAPLATLKKLKKLTLLYVTWVFSGPDTELSCYLASGTGLRSTKCETCGTKILNSPRGCRKEPLTGEGDQGSSEGSSGDSCCSHTMSRTFNLSFLEFHYRYNTPGQNHSNHGGGNAFVQLHFLNENKNSSPCKYISYMIPSL